MIRCFLCGKERWRPMTMPHKICPQCGQPAVLAMTQCQRCGFVYGPSPPVPSHTPMMPNSRETPRAQQVALQRKRSVGPLVLLIVLGSALFLGMAVLRSVGRTTSQRATGAARRLPSGSALNAAPTDTTAPPGKLSMFTESESQQEMPVLTFRNWDNSTLTLTLRDRYGHVYRASSRQETVATLQVPTGDYSVSLDSDDPRVRPNWGDAVFRKFKSYRADFIVGHSDFTAGPTDFPAEHSDTRIHLGD